MVMNDPSGRDDDTITALLKTFHMVGQFGVNALPQATKILCIIRYGFSAVAQDRLGVLCIATARCVGSGNIIRHQP